MSTTADELREEVRRRYAEHVCALAESDWPELVRDFQSVIGTEARAEQLGKRIGDEALGALHCPSQIAVRERDAELDDVPGGAVRAHHAELRAREDADARARVAVDADRLEIEDRRLDVDRHRLPGRERRRAADLVAAGAPGGLRAARLDARGVLYPEDVAPRQGVAIFERVSFFLIV